MVVKSTFSINVGINRFLQSNQIDLSPTVKTHRTVDGDRHVCVSLLFKCPDCEQLFDRFQQKNKFGL